jgi:hypothetical protein
VLMRFGKIAAKLLAVTVGTFVLLIVLQPG